MLQVYKYTYRIFELRTISFQVCKILWKICVVPFNEECQRHIKFSGVLVRVIWIPWFSIRCLLSPSIINFFPIENIFENLYPADVALSSKYFVLSSSPSSRQNPACKLGPNYSRQYSSKWSNAWLVMIKLKGCLACSHSQLKIVTTMVLNDQVIYSHQS
jgi:hypothetical protein